MLLSLYEDNFNGSFESIFIACLWMGLYTAYTLSYIHNHPRDVALRDVYA